MGLVRSLMIALLPTARSIIPASIFPFAFNVTVNLLNAIIYSTEYLAVVHHPHSVFIFTPNVEHLDGCSRPILIGPLLRCQSDCSLIASAMGRESASFYLDTQQGAATILQLVINAFCHISSFARSRESHAFFGKLLSEELFCGKFPFQTDKRAVEQLVDI